MSGPAISDFSSLLFARARGRGLLRPGILNFVEPFAHLAYEDELHLKRTCLSEFWHANGLSGQLHPLVPSLLPRKYRTTTKRRVVTRPGSVQFVFGSEQSTHSGVTVSALEPDTHLEVYRCVHDVLAERRFRQVAEHLNYVIVRGGERQSVIFNVRTLNRILVAGLKDLARRLRECKPSVRSAFVFLDPTGSSYYLETLGSLSRTICKRLFGPRQQSVAVDGMRYTFPPTVFSQVNGSMLSTLVRTVRRILGPDPSLRLLDLYCGYGLFACALAAETAEVIGVEADTSAIASAVENARRLATRYRIRFIAGRVSAELLGQRLPPAGTLPEIVVLDPPRNGTQDGVIEAVAARHPVRVLHIFCNTDCIPLEVGRWRRQRYRVVHAVPLDMFPGTTALETLVLLSPAGPRRDRAGGG